MGGGGEGPLPPGAVRIEYLQNTDAQKIKTGITLQAGDYPTLIIDCELIQKNNNYDNCPVGTYRTSPLEFAGICFRGNDLDILYTFGTGATATFLNYNLGTRYRIVGNSSNGSYINDALLSSDYVNVSTTNNREIYLFVRNANGNVNAEYFKGRIYSCQIIINGTTVRDFIPVRVGQTGYMYDRVSGTLFGNSGTGDFVLGPDKT